MVEKREDRLITLEEFIIQSQNRFPGAAGELSQLLRDIVLAAKIISREVNKAGITREFLEEHPADKEPARSR